MTTNVGESQKLDNTSKKALLLDGQTVAKLFSKIKENEKINKKVRVKVNRQPMKQKEDIDDKVMHNRKDFADQMIYYRNLLGYSRKQVGQAIGLSEDSYRRYELKELEMTDKKRIKKIVRFLKFDETPKLSNYVEFLMSNPAKKLEQFLKKNKISKNKFSQLSGISRRAMLDWFNGKKSISKESYEKIMEFMKTFQSKERE